MKRLIIFSTVIAAILFTVGATTYARTALENASKAVEQSKPVKVLSKYETGPPDPQELLELVNKERAKVGVAPLKLDLRLNKTAQMKADDMVKNHYYNHVNPKTGKHGYQYILDNYPTLCREASENLVFGTNKDTTSKLVVDAWVGSPKHYKAMVSSKYTLTGFGISGKHVVEHFCEVY